MSPGVSTLLPQCPFCPPPNPELDIQLFIKPNQVTNFHSVQNDYPTTGYVGPLLGQCISDVSERVKPLTSWLGLKTQKEKAACPSIS